MFKEEGLTIIQSLIHFNSIYCNIFHQKNKKKSFLTQSKQVKRSKKKHKKIVHRQTEKESE